MHNIPVRIKWIEIHLNIKHIPFHYQTSNILVDITLHSQTTGNFNTQYENIHNQCHGTHCFNHCQKIRTKSLFIRNQEHGRSPISTVSNLTSMILTIFKNRSEYCSELCVTFPVIPPQIKNLQLLASRIVSIMKHVLTQTLMSNQHDYSSLFETWRCGSLSFSLLVKSQWNPKVTALFWT